MMEEFDSQSKEATDSGSVEVFTESFRAGRRTYFFDVKASRNSEYYITITESKRKILSNGKMTYEKHHIYLYKEDFEKFASALQSVLDYVHEKQPAAIEANLPEEPKLGRIENEEEELVVAEFNFEDLENK